MSKLPDELLTAMEGEWRVGETKRIIHTHREDGSPCSIGKNPAMSVTRRTNGFAYMCHRCKFKGFEFDWTCTPEQVEEELEKLKKDPEYESVAQAELPYDFKPLKEDPNNTPDIPIQAYNWMYRYGLLYPVYSKFDIGWSDAYTRCIIPIYEYAQVGTDLAKKLVGWIGRDVRVKTKEERKKDGIPKYLTKKAFDYKRIYFHAPAESNMYVIVEDAVSAMKVWNAMHCNTYALLNTTVTNELLLRLKGKEVVIWLDGDQLENMINIVAHGNSLGLDVKHVYTRHDPKDYNEFAIQALIKGESV